MAEIFQLLPSLQMTGILGGLCETFIFHYIVLSLLLVLSQFCMNGTLWRWSNTLSHC